MTNGPYSNFPPEKIAEVKRLAAEGLSAREICRRVGTHHHNVRPIVAEMEAAGELPDNCPCGLPRGRGHRNLACSFSTAPKRGYPKVRVSRLTKEQVREIHDLAAEGVSNRQIAERTGRALVTVNRHVAIWMRKREAAGKPLKPCKCGRPARHPGGCIKNSPSVLSRDRIKRIERWAREGVSAAEMGRRSRIISNTAGIATILKYARPVWEQMTKEGIFCDCGEVRGHPAVCAATWDSGGRVRGPQPIPADVQQRIANALLNGDSIIAIRRRLEISEKKVLRIFRAMTREERSRRAKIVHRRVREGEAGERLHGTNLLARIRSALPADIDPSLRDDVVSELYLAVLQGDITVDSIEARSKTYLSKAFNLWANSFGPQSMDEAVGPEGGRTLADIVPDHSYLDQIDDIDFGDEW